MKYLTKSRLRLASFQPPSDRVIRAGFFTTIPIAIGTTGKGTSLGLSLAYVIVTIGNGGNIQVKSNYCPPEGTLEVVSNKGGGSAFIITLPF